MERKCRHNFLTFTKLNNLLEYWPTMASIAPGVGTMLLETCLFKIHKDIITLWNFNEGEKVGLTTFGIGYLDSI